MTVSKEDLLKALRAVKEPLAAAVTNARVRKVRRVLNEDEPVDAGYEDVVEDVPAEDGTAEVGDKVVIQPTGDEITGEIVEVVEDAPEEEEVLEEEPVENRRRYRRVKNARILRNADGTRDVIVPVDEKKVTNVRRYKTRSVALNGSLPVDGAYAKTISTPDIGSLATVINKAKKYDELLLNATIEQSIDDAVKKALQKSGSGGGTSLNSSCTKKTCNTKQTAKQYRFRNYRRVRNEDGTIEIDVDLADAIPVVDPVAAVGDVAAPAIDSVVDPAADIAVDVPPVADTAIVSPVESVDIIVDGREVPLDNSRKYQRVRNASRPAVVKNESSLSDTFGLDVPSTFPSAENK